MNRWIACGLLAIIIGFYVNGQSEFIDTIQIQAPSLRSSNFGGPTTLLNSQGNISDRLGDNGSVFIKNYGPGSLATSSIRGGSASHTLVLWNDLPIQNPFLGLLDLSLLDTWSINEVRLQKGGNTAMWGSGAIGGVISMDQKNEEKGRWAISNDLSVGSFGRLHERAKLSVGKGNFRSISSFSILKADNDFPFVSGNNMEKIQSNAMQRQENFNQDLYWTLSDKNEIAVHYWRSRATRENPPTTVQSRSKAFQIDKADRITAQWKFLGEKNKLKINTGYFIENLHYFDPLILLESATHFETFVLDVSNEVKIRTHHVLNFGLSHYRTEVSSPSNYSSLAKESRIAAFLRYQYKWLQISGRQEVVDGRRTPMMPALAIEVPLHKHIGLKGKISRNYRLPTLNDRFWNPGGNPDLQAESGWSEEISLLVSNEIFKSSFTAFNRIIDNWIQWSVHPRERILRPYNLNRVWSRGLEITSSYQYKILRLNLGYNFIKSTNTKAVTFPKTEIGDQLFYTPTHSGYAGVLLQYKKWVWRYNQRFNGKTLGINDNLESWTTGDTSLDLAYKRIGFYGKIYNIWNAHYRVIERRPIPGRHFEIGINLNFVKN